MNLLSGESGGSVFFALGHRKKAWWITSGSGVIIHVNLPKNLITPENIVPDMDYGDTDADPYAECYSEFLRQHPGDVISRMLSQKF